MQVCRARDELVTTKDAMVGHVIFGLPPSAAMLLTVPLLKSFRNSFPQGTFSMVEALSASVMEWLLEGRIDIGLVYNPAPLPSVEIRPLRDQHVFLISSKDAADDRQSKSVPFRDLARYPLIVPSRTNANWMMIDTQLAHFGLKPRIAFEIDGIATMDRAAEAQHPAGVGDLRPAADDSAG
jgi:LysR family transcriptional regulator, nitrogen assimilation regulatory protein